MTLLTRQVRFVATYDTYTETPRHSGAEFCVDVCVDGPIHPVNGMVINFFALDPLLHKALVEPFHHQHLNQAHPAFTGKRPTLERMALVLKDRLETELSATDLTLHHLRLSASPDCFVELIPAPEKALTPC